MGLFNKLHLSMFGGKNQAPAATPNNRETNPFDKDVRDLANGDEVVASALANLYARGSETRREYYSAYAKIKDFYLTEVILEMLSEDALTPDITTGEVIEVHSDDEKINNELIELQKTINFDRIIDDIVMDFLACGEYTLRNKIVKGKGVVGIVDDVVQHDTIAFYEQGIPYKFMQKQANTLKLAEPAHFSHFSLGKHKLRIDLNVEFQGLKPTLLLLPEGIPTYVRVGRPVFYGIISKIKELQLLENLVPADKLNKVTKGSYVGIQVPPATTPEDGFKIVRKYENMLNKRQGVDRDLEDLTIADILTTAGKVKVVPIFGEKGRLDSLSINDDSHADDLLNNIKDNREIILTSAGIPPALVFGGDGPKSEILKQYARYLRKLKSIQIAIAQGVKQIVYAHLSNKYEEGQEGKEGAKIGIPYEESDIKVNFRNELTNIDELDKLEFSAAIVGTLRDVNEFIMELEDNEKMNDIVDIEKYKKYLRRQLSFINSGVDFLEPEEEDFDVTGVAEE